MSALCCGVSATVHWPTIARSTSWPCARAQVVARTLDHIDSVSCQGCTGRLHQCMPMHGRTVLGWDRGKMAEHVAPSDDRWRPTAAA